MGLDVGALVGLDVGALVGFGVGVPAGFEVGSAVGFGVSAFFGAEVSVGFGVCVSAGPSESVVSTEVCVSGLFFPVAAPVQADKRTALSSIKTAIGFEYFFTGIIL